jgi:hypothetical protein
MVNKSDKGGDSTLDEKLAQNKRDMEQLVKDGISDIKSILGEKLADVAAKTDVCSKVLRDVIADSREEEYNRHVEDKLARNASLVFSRPNGGAVIQTTAEELWKFIHAEFPPNEAPGFFIEPIGKNGAYRLFPECFSPSRSRQICATVLRVLKEGGFKAKFGLNAFYDNPFFLRKIRSEALRFTATFLQKEGLKLGTKPFVKRGVMMYDGVPMFSECFVPLDESYWDAAFSVLGELVRDKPGLGDDDSPVAEADMRDLFVASKGLVFPRAVAEARAGSPMAM